VIGLVIVGPGTSFPELIASITAALRKDVGMVLGNILGSNIFNIFFTLGATALIMPIPLDLALKTAVIINVAVTALLVAYVALSKNCPLFINCRICLKPERIIRQQNADIGRIG